MKVAFNVFPLKSAHKNRGIGYYTQNLLEGLKKEHDLEILEFTDLSEIKGVDLIHYPWFDFFFHTLPVKRPYPTVVSVHDVIPLKFAKHYPAGVRGKLNLTLQKWAIKSCEAIITDSKVSKADIQTYLKIPSDKVKVIYLASDPQFRVLPDAKLIYTKRKHSLPEKFLLYIGDANWVKNVPFLILGFNEIIKTAGFDQLKLVLVGEVFLKNVESIDHPELTSLKEVNRLIKLYNLENSVMRLGKIEKQELVAILNLAILYIQPSVYEGFGLPILQAFACGLPVLAANSGSLPEVGGDAAVYFNHENLNQFKYTALELLHDKSLREKLQKMGFEQLKKFSWKKVILETKAVYKNIKDKE